MKPQLRIARPVGDLEKSVEMYRTGLDLKELFRFQNHAGFDGVMLGWPGAEYHFEFTVCRTHPVAPTPTPEDLLVLYLPDRNDWQSTCASMLQAGFLEVASFNPYWQERGRTFQDHDGYRVVPEQSAWDSK